MSIFFSNFFFFRIFQFLMWNHQILIKFFELFVTFFFSQFFLWLSIKTISLTFFEFFFLNLVLLFLFISSILIFLSFFFFLFFTDISLNFFKFLLFFLPVFFISEASAGNGEGDLIVKIEASTNSPSEDLALPKIIKNFSENNTKDIESVISLAPQNSFSVSSKNLQQATKSYEFLTESLNIKNAPKGTYTIPSSVAFPSEKAVILFPSPELDSLAKFDKYFYLNKTNDTKILQFNDHVYLFSQSTKKFELVNFTLNDNILNYLKSSDLKLFNLKLKQGLSVPAISIPLLDNIMVNDNANVIGISSNKSARDFDSLEHKILTADLGSNLNIMCKDKTNNLTLVSRLGLNNPELMVQDLRSITLEDSLNFTKNLDAQNHFINTKIKPFPHKIDTFRENSLSYRFNIIAQAPKSYYTKDFSAQSLSLIKKIFKR